MKEPDSYYDWELKLKKKPKRKKGNNGGNCAELGISIEDFRKIVKKWKKKNHMSRIIY